jgi:ABC-type Zn uptake system ZnuABC Zn-binding protein ZnuA
MRAISCQTTIAILWMLQFSAFAQPKPLVVATASIFADMAANIGGDAVTVRSIVPIGGDPHMYEPTPGDAQLAASANLILRNGLTFEGWLNELIANSGTKANVVLITKNVQVIESQHYKNATDPHAWMDAQQGLIYLENIKNALIELVPEQRPMFEFNYNIYREQLQEMDTYIQQQIQTIPQQQRVLITSHDAFRYYARRYGIRVEAVLGTSTDAEVQTADIIRLNRVIEESGVPSVFIETTVNPKIIQQLATDNQVEIGGKLYSDSIGDKQSPAPTYLDMLKYNTDTIVKALRKSKSGATVAMTGDGSISLLFGAVLAGLLIGGFLFVFNKLNI